jgi:hypothetical protein
MQIEPERFDLIGELASGYPSQVIAEQTIEVYAKDLSDLPLDVLRTAVETCRREFRFFPAVADIREKAAALKVTNNEPPIDCPRCFGVGMEIRKDKQGYSTTRRCDHITDSDVDQW